MAVDGSQGTESISSVIFPQMSRSVEGLSSEQRVFL